jgi:hypothetical protein
MTPFTTQTNTSVEKRNRESEQVEPQTLGRSRQVWGCEQIGVDTKKDRGLTGWQGGPRFCKHDRNDMNHLTETQPSFLTKRQRHFPRSKQDCNDDRTTASFLRASYHFIHFQNRAFKTRSSPASGMLPLLLLSTQLVHSRSSPDTETED